MVEILQTDAVGVRFPKEVNRTLDAAIPAAVILFFNIRT